MTAPEVIAHLNLRPHPKEGGFFVEGYRSDELLPAAVLPPRYSGPRCLGTSIYYLLTSPTFSAIHRLRSDEVFHFHLGDPVEILNLDEDHPERSRISVLGPDLAAGQALQVIVPRGLWQGARLVPGGEWALMGTTVAPGFEYADFELGQRAELKRRFPKYVELIRALTHKV